MTGHKLSIIIPCYNEGLSIHQVLDHVANACLRLPVAAEIIVVNDGSTDQTSQKIRAFAQNTHIKVVEVTHDVNKGKGASIRTALAYITGTIVVIQDADLEYDPTDFQKMLPLIINEKADVVYGSRFRGSEAHRVLFFLHTLGNKFLTFVSNLFTQLNLTDMETGYKMFRTDILKMITLKENRFGFEPEVTAKVSKIKNIRIYEVGIAYYGRTYEE